MATALAAVENAEKIQIIIDGKETVITPTKEIPTEMLIRGVLGKHLEANIRSPQ